MNLYVGQPTQHHDPVRYRKAGFNFWELMAEPGRLPKPNKLSALSVDAGAKRMKISVALSPKCLAIGGGAGEAAAAAQAALDYGLRVVQRVNPHWVVIQSSAQFRPGASSERQLDALLDRLREAGITTEGAEPNAPRLAWEPRGLWAPEQAEDVAQGRALAVVRDPRTLRFRGEAPSQLYLRWTQLGTTARPSDFAIEDLVQQVAGVDELFVVVQGGDGRRFARTLRQQYERSQDDDAELSLAGEDAAGPTESS